MFVWVDESGIHSSMTRLRARAPKGEQRTFGSVPRNRGKNTTLIASMTLEGAMGECMAVEGSTKAFVFEAYVERFLVPSLSPGRVVMDNLAAHKTGMVRELIEGGRGCELCGSCRPTRRPQPYRGGLQQGEGHLRKVAARTREALVEAMGEALWAVTLRDAKGWFAHCSYGHTDQYS